MGDDDDVNDASFRKNQILIGFAKHRARPNYSREYGTFLH